jgi:hypothetical protein
LVLLRKFVLPRLCSLQPCYVSAKAAREGGIARHCQYIPPTARSVGYSSAGSGQVSTSFLFAFSERTIRPGEKLLDCHAALYIARRWCTCPWLHAHVMPTHSLHPVKQQTCHRVDSGQLESRRCETSVYDAAGSRWTDTTGGNRRCAPPAKADWPPQKATIFSGTQSRVSHRRRTRIWW